MHCDEPCTSELCVVLLLSLVLREKKPLEQWIYRHFSFILRMEILLSTGLEWTQWTSTNTFNRLDEWKFDLEWSKYVTLHKNILLRWAASFRLVFLLVLFRRNGIQVGAYTHSYTYNARPVYVNAHNRSRLSFISQVLYRNNVHSLSNFLSLSLSQCKAVPLWSVEALSQCVELTFDSQTKKKRKKWTIRFVVHTRTIAHINGMLVSLLLLLMPCFILSSFFLALSSCAA